jgi:hypothetical protein
MVVFAHQSLEIDVSLQWYRRGLPERGHNLRRLREASGLRASSSFPRRCSISMRNSFSSCRIIGTGSDASGSGAEDVRLKG